MPELTADYWEQRYQAQNTPWQIGHPSRPLREYMDTLADKSLRILLPGGGDGEELAYLHAQGFVHSTVLDWSATAIGRLRKRHPALPDSAFVHADFFTHAGQYDLILEQTFLAALPPEVRPRYAPKMAELLAPGGRLAGVLFNFPLDPAKGPPWGGTPDYYRQLFAPALKIQVLETCTTSEPERSGKELWVEAVAQC